MLSDECEIGREDGKVANVMLEKSLSNDTATTKTALRRWLNRSSPLTLKQAKI